MTPEFNLRSFKISLAFSRSDLTPECDRLFKIIKRKFWFVSLSLSLSLYLYFYPYYVYLSLSLSLTRTLLLTLPFPALTPSLSPPTHKHPQTQTNTHAHTHTHTHTNTLFFWWRKVSFRWKSLRRFFEKRFFWKMSAHHWTGWDKVVFRRSDKKIQFSFFEIEFRKMFLIHWKIGKMYF